MKGINIRQLNLHFVINCATGLGNIILFLPSFKSLKEKYPTAKFSIILDERWINETFIKTQFGNNCDFLVMRNPKKSLISFIKDIKVIRRKKYSVALGAYCGNSWKIGLLLLLVNAKKIIYFKTSSVIINKYIDILYNIKEGMHYVERNYLQLNDLDVEFSKPRKWLEVNLNLIEKTTRIKGSNKWLGMHTGGNLEFNSARQWSKENFKEFVRLLSKNYDFKIILFAKGDQEIKFNREISLGIENQCIFWENTNLDEVAVAISLCDIFIGNDSGLIHMSAGLGKETIAIIGPTNPFHTGPYGNNNHVISLELECMPCFDKDLSLNCNHHNCINLLSAKYVFDKFNEIVNQRSF